jgi:hypothetical protein
MHQYGDDLKAEAMLMHLGLADKAQRAQIRSEDDLLMVFAHLQGWMYLSGYLFRDFFAVRLMLKEAVTNALRDSDDVPDKLVELTYIVTPSGVVADIQNQGQGVLFNATPAELAADNPGRFSSGGVSLMHMYATWLYFHKAANRLTLCRRRSEHPKRCR